MVKVLRTIVIILVFAVYAACITALVVLLRQPAVPDNPPEEPAEFTVTYDGTDYTVSDEDIKITLPESGQARFTVSGAESYTVKVISELYNSDTDTGVYAELDGKTPIILNGKDLTSEFIITEMPQDGYFTITCAPDYYDLLTLLKRRYNSDDVVIYNDNNSDMIYPYIMQITSSDGEVIEMQLRQEQ